MKYRVLGDRSGKCKCSPDQVQRYLSKLSGPLLDRIDIQLYIPRIPHSEFRQTPRNPETSKDIRLRVIRARAVQFGRQGKLNSLLTSKEIDHLCKLDGTGEELLDKVMAKFTLSTRAYHRILKLSRTIADLKEAPHISSSHLSSAIKMRCMDSNLGNSTVTR